MSTTLPLQQTARNKVT